jgi:phospholipid-binding lipoprotein MlaA
MYALRSLLAAVACLVVLCALASGCATTPEGRKGPDPLEPLNRSVYGFNDAADRVVLKPLATVYTEVVPLPVRGGVTNFFGNFRDVTTAVNGLLQGKFKQAASDAGRVAVNTSVGLLGVFDVASRLGLAKHDEDFGQTFGYWGVPEGPYLVLPFLGPSTVRDGLGLLPEFYLTDPQFFVFDEPPGEWIALGVRYVNFRANLFEAEKVFREAAFDEYAFLRDGYLQRRRSLIFDGSLPEGAEQRGPKRKTLRELEEELDLDTPAPAQEAPAK